MEASINLNVKPMLLEAAATRAKQRGVSLTYLVENFLTEFLAETDTQTKSSPLKRKVPISDEVKQLTGLFATSGASSDYREDLKTYWDEKYK